MTVRRWSATTAVLGVVAWVLWSLSPAVTEVRSAVADPQGLVDRAGADALLLVVVPVLAWVCWGWGALGLLLTAASTAPGWSGRAARLLLAHLLPVGARQVAAVALGVGLSTVTPTVAAPVAPPVATASAAEHLDRPAGSIDVDWPGTPAGDARPEWSPDWPGAGSDDHVVLRGDCLWDIAADWLSRQTPGVPVPAAQVQRAVQAWWQANADVIGADPDLLLPGQVLRPPG